MSIALVPWFEDAVSYKACHVMQDPCMQADGAGANHTPQMQRPADSTIDALGAQLDTYIREPRRSLWAKNRSPNRLDAESRSLAHLKDKLACLATILEDLAAASDEERVVLLQKIDVARRELNAAGIACQPLVGLGGKELIQQVITFSNTKQVEANKMRAKTVMSRIPQFRQDDQQGKQDQNTLEHAGRRPSADRPPPAGVTRNGEAGSLQAAAAAAGGGAVRGPQPLSKLPVRAPGPVFPTAPSQRYQPAGGQAGGPSPASSPEALGVEEAVRLASPTRSPDSPQLTADSSLCNLESGLRLTASGLAGEGAAAGGDTAASLECTASSCAPSLDLPSGWAELTLPRSLGDGLASAPSAPPDLDLPLAAQQHRGSSQNGTAAARAPGAASKLAAPAPAHSSAPGCDTSAGGGSGSGGNPLAARRSSSGSLSLAASSLAAGARAQAQGSARPGRAAGPAVTTAARRSSSGSTPLAPPLTLPGPPPSLQTSGSHAPLEPPAPSATRSSSGVLVPRLRLGAALEQQQGASTACSPPGHELSWAEADPHSVLVASPHGLPAEESCRAAAGGSWDPALPPPPEPLGPPTPPSPPATRHSFNGVLKTAGSAPPGGTRSLPAAEALAEGALQPPPLSTAWGALAARGVGATSCSSSAAHTEATLAPSSEAGEAQLLARTSTAAAAHYSALGAALGAAQAGEGGGYGGAAGGQGQPDPHRPHGGRALAAEESGVQLAPLPRCALPTSLPPHLPSCTPATVLASAHQLAALGIITAPPPPQQHAARPPHPHAARGSSEQGASGSQGSGVSAPTSSTHTRARSASLRSAPPPGPASPPECDDSELFPARPLALSGGDCVEEFMGRRRRGAGGLLLRALGLLGTAASVAVATGAAVCVAAAMNSSVELAMVLQGLAEVDPPPRAASQGRRPAHSAQRTRAPPPPPFFPQPADSKAADTHAAETKAVHSKAGARSALLAAGRG
ncbi:hypothetical protein QJQ45_019645 [Haematococcus lacustris]|nr:hypothetical protein QJQ45_019645 [Haematococcus lacustris]